MSIKYKTYTMEEALEAIIDYRGKTPHKSDNGIPTLSAKSVKNNYIDYDKCYYISLEEYNRFMVRGFPQKGDILLTTEALLGMVARLDRNNIAIAQRLLTLRGNKNILDNNYLLYYLQSPDGQTLLKTHETGTTVTGIKQAVFRRLTIPLPPLDTQRKIASILSALDDKIELNRRMNENLEAQARALFKEMVLNDSSNDTNLVTLDEICNIFTGRKNANESTNNGKYKFFTCTPDNLFIDSFIYDGDAVIISGNGAYTGRTRFYSGRFDLYQRTYACTLKSNVSSDIIFMVYWSIKCNLVQNIMGDTRGSAIPYIVMNDLSKFKINLSKYTISRYGSLFKIITQQILFNEQMNDSFIHIRDTLLPKLMRGEIDVENVAISS